MSNPKNFDRRAFVTALTAGAAATGLAAAARAGWFTYINVEDADAAAKRCTQNGGKVLVQPFDSDENVRITVIQDPEGATVGLVSKRPG